MYAHSHMELQRTSPEGKWEDKMAQSHQVLCVPWCSLSGKMRQPDCCASSPGSLITYNWDPCTSICWVASSTICHEQHQVLSYITQSIVMAGRKWSLENIKEGDLFCLNCYRVSCSVVQDLCQLNQWMQWGQSQKNQIKGKSRPF